MSELRTEILNAIQMMEQEQSAKLTALENRIATLETELSKCNEVQIVLDESLNTLALLSEELLKASGSSFRQRG